MKISRKRWTAVSILLGDLKRQHNCTKPKNTKKLVKLKKCFMYRLRFPVLNFIPNDMVFAIFAYMSFGIKFSTGNLNPYVKHLLELTNGEAVCSCLVRHSQKGIAFGLFGA